MELNSNHSNSNDADDDSGTAGSSSRGRRGKRKARGASKRKSITPRKGKKLAQDDESEPVVEGEDSLQASSEEHEVPSPKKEVNFQTQRGGGCR